ncbi:flagellar protein FliT [Saccharococcus thermophilus]|uniref:Flagellar protein FliT n=1 Tax=Saccharococcus thermophilus TaxID=29396 RepID=A0A846MLG9_9BACL|nr:flagellar protein FliT [Saccharococcus thermophilus]NIK16481.1 flagellar protein FliT [Saccharococcus thermophilus]
MSVVTELFHLTKELRDLVCAPVQAEKRGETIETIKRLLAEREELLRELRPPYSEEEQRLGRQIVLWNQEIDAQLRELKRQIQRDLTMIRQKKIANHHYVNPYGQSLAIDGMFYDKKR